MPGEKDFLVDLNLNKNELKQAVFENLPAPPASPKKGQHYFNTITRIQYYWNGSVWIPITPYYYGIISGSATWSGAGLTFDVTRCLYYILGIYHDTLLATQVTLTPANVTNPRIDVIYLDDQNTVGVLTGIAAPSPGKPVVDQETQIELTSVLVLAGALTPGGISEELVYDEHVAPPTEWVPTASAGGVNFDYGVNPFTGIKNIRVPVTAIKSKIAFVRSAVVDLLSTATFLKLHVRLSAVSPFQLCTVQLMAGNQVVSAPVVITSGSYGFDKDIVGAWQVIAIPLNIFPVMVDTQIDTLIINYATSIDFQLDRITFQIGGNVPGALPNYWNLSGNAIDASRFLGTTNNQPVNFKSNNLQIMRLQAGALHMEDTGALQGGSYPIVFHGTGNFGVLQQGSIGLDSFLTAGYQAITIAAGASTVNIGGMDGVLPSNGKFTSVNAAGFQMFSSSATNGFKLYQGYDQSSGKILDIQNNIGAIPKMIMSISWNGIARIDSLKTTGVTPVMTGTKRMMVCDINGDIGFQAIPGGGGGGGEDLQATTDIGNTSTNSIIFNGAARAIFNPITPREILRITRPTAYTGGQPFTMFMDEAANGDGTYNHPIYIGFNVGGLTNPAYGGNGFSIEPDYRPGGAILRELHYVTWHPGSAVSTRLMSSTYVQGSTAANSSNLWYFKGTSFEVRPISVDNAFFLVEPVNGLKLYNPTISVTDFLQLSYTGGSYGSSYAKVGFEESGTAHQHATMMLDTRAGVDPFRWFVAASGTAAFSAMSLTTDGKIRLGDLTAQNTFYKDVIEWNKKFTIVAGEAGELLWTIKSEKFNIAYAGHGTMGSWNAWLARNWYNGYARPGEILTMNSYNLDHQGGPLIAGESAWGQVYESDYNVTGEYYHTFINQAGAAYRPFAMYMHKTTGANDITFKGSVFHVTPSTLASDYANFKNGKTVLTYLAGAPSEVTQPTLILEYPGTAKPEFALQNNGSAGLFSGMSFYGFDNHLYAFLDNTTDLGIGGSSWRDIYIKRQIFLNNSAGTPGQVLISGGPSANPTWSSQWNKAGSDIYITSVNVGIGIALPTASLHVKGAGATSATYALKIQNSAAVNILSARNDGLLTIGAAVFIDNGNVGIGTFPSILLDINSTGSSARIYDGVNGSGYYSDISIASIGDVIGVGNGYVKVKVPQKQIILKGGIIVNYLETGDNDFASTDEHATLSFVGSSAIRTLTLHTPTDNEAQVMTIVTGSLFGVNLSSVPVWNTDGTLISRIPPGGSVTIQYDSLLSKWIVLNLTSVTQPAGTFTPVSSLDFNCTTAPEDFHYTQNGNIVTFTGVVYVTASGGAGGASYDISLPIASAFSQPNDAIGIGISPSGGAERIYISAASATIHVVFEIFGSGRQYLTGQYQII